MKIQESKELKQLSMVFRLSEKATALLVIHGGLKNELFEDEPECYGVSIKDHCDGLGVSTLDAFKIMFPLIDPDLALQFFEELKTIGDGECPHCGGELEYLEGEHKQTAGDYYTQPEYKAVYEIYQCSACGEKTEK